MKKLLLHICCGPCATASIKKIKSEGYEITGFYYNPNIHPAYEYKKRLKEAKKIASEADIDLVVREYEPRKYFQAVRGKEQVFKERCVECWKLRLESAAKFAKENEFTYLATTLRISPHQNQRKLLKTLNEVSGKYGLGFYETSLLGCFHDSVLMSKERGLYRQKYCGCIFSRRYS